ncbi:MAG: outer membrane beta-barrel protein [Gammaproteobacteria bacterium]
MKKTLLTLICLSALGSAAAFANGEASDVAPLVATPAASNSGFYVGAQAGLGRIDEGNGYKDAADWIFNLPGYTSVSKDTSQGGFAGRLLVGYSFNQYFGLETGYTFLPNNKYNAEYNLGGILDVKENVKFKTWTWDLLAKATYPINDSWDVYAKLGAAYVKATSSGEADLTQSGAATEVESYNFSQSAIRPAYGLGVTYKFNPNWAMDLAWTGTYGKSRTSFNSSTGISNKDSVIPTTNTIMLGVIYKFASL